VAGMTAASLSASIDRSSIAGESTAGAAAAIALEKANAATSAVEQFFRFMDSPCTVLEKRAEGTASTQ
jgi:hypothetical protein